jgi:type VI secretion system protein VasD
MTTATDELRSETQRSTRGDALASALRALIAIAAVFGAYGCAGTMPTCKVPTAVELEIETSDRVNRDDEGRSLPTLLRLYQVRDLSALQMSSFEDILEHAKETLGDTLLETDELTVYPGQVMVSRFERNEQADFVVGVAVFRNPVGTAWRTIEEWPMPGDPCKEQDDDKAGPKLADLRIRMFLEDYRVESVNNFNGMRRRSCAEGDQRCADADSNAPDELPEELRHRRLRTFEEDPSRPKPTAGGEDKSP